MDVLYFIRVSLTMYKCIYLYFHFIFGIIDGISPWLAGTGCKSIESRKLHTNKPNSKNELQGLQMLSTFVLHLNVVFLQDYHHPLLRYNFQS